MCDPVADLYLFALCWRASLGMRRTCVFPARLVFSFSFFPPKIRAIQSKMVEVDEKKLELKRAARKQKEAAQVRTPSFLPLWPKVFHRCSSSHRKRHPLTGAHGAARDLLSYRR